MCFKIVRLLLISVLLLTAISTYLIAQIVIVGWQNKVSAARTSKRLRVYGGTGFFERALHGKPTLIAKMVEKFSCSTKLGRYLTSLFEQAEMDPHRLVPETSFLVQGECPAPKSFQSKAIQLPSGLWFSGMPVERSATNEMLKLVYLSLFIFLLALAVFRSLLISLVSIFSFWVIFLTVLWQKGRRYQDCFFQQLPEAFRMISDLLKSGNSLPKAIEVTSREIQMPLKAELVKVSQKLVLGMNLPEALEHLDKKFPSSELKTVIAAMVIQQRLGGNLAKLLKTTAAVLEEKIDLRNELMSETAQVRFSGKIVGFMPLVVIAGLLIVSPSFVMPLFRTHIGVIILLTAMVAEMTGFILIRQVTDIKI
jgi:Flp pilus assembly protein TadB